MPMHWLKRVPNLYKCILEKHPTSLLNYVCNRCSREDVYTDMTAACTIPTAAVN
jgi:hypothetical protein